MTAAQYAALLLTDADESASWDLAEGRYRYVKDQFPELGANGCAELSLAMAFEKIADAFTPQQLEISTLIAGQSLTASQYHFVQMVAGDVFTAATAGQRGIIGVVQNAPALGSACLIAGGGIVPVLSGVAITKGASVMSDATGLAITAAAGVANHLFGYALEAASGAGVLIDIAFGYQGPVTNAT